MNDQSNVKVRSSIEQTRSFSLHKESISTTTREAFFDFLSRLDSGSVDIYLRNENANKWPICAGRREESNKKASAVLVCFRILRGRIEYKITANDLNLGSLAVTGELTPSTIDELLKQELIEQFVSLYPKPQGSRPPFYSIQSNEPVLLDKLFHEILRSLGKYEEDWLLAYRKLVERVNKAKVDGRVDESLLKEIWLERENSISSLKQGCPSQAEYDKNLNVLLAITEDVIRCPSHEVYTSAYLKLEELKTQGELKRHYRACLNRLFAAVKPKKLTTIVTDSAMDAVINFFSSTFGYESTTNDDWYLKNVNLKNFIHSRLEEGVDELKLNIALWLIYVAKSDKGEATDGPVTVLKRQVEYVEATLREADLEVRFVNWLRKEPEYTGYEIESQSRDLTIDNYSFFRDVTLKRDDHKIIAELKFKSEAKSDIEAALGQLLRYALYPGTESCNEIWVVGGNTPSKDELKWFEEVSNVIAMPLKYFYSSADREQFECA